MNIHWNKYVWQYLYQWFSALLLQNTNVLWQYAFECAFIALNYHASWEDNVFGKVIDSTNVGLKSVGGKKFLTVLLDIVFLYWVCIISDFLHRRYWKQEIHVSCFWLIMRLLILVVIRIAPLNLIQICQLIENVVTIVCTSRLLLSVLKKYNVLQQVFWSLLSDNFLYRSLAFSFPLWIRLTASETKEPSIFMPAAWTSIIQTCNWMWVLGGTMNIQCHKY